MSLFSLPPASPQADLNLSLFLGGNGGGSSHTLARTLAAEWFPQSGVQIAWPHAATDWAYMLGEITECYLRLTYEIATREPLLVVTPRADALRKLFEEKLPARATDHITIHECPTNDTWTRDYGLLSVTGSEGTELLDFRFNGWGGKFEAGLDNAVSRRLTQGETPVLRGRYVDCNDFELEGGSIETDGQGTLLTTAQCLLNPNRNPQLDRAAKEALLCERLGVKRVLWLEHGALAGDDTDSHIDTLARLCPQDSIAYTRCEDKLDEHYDGLLAMEHQLRSFRTAKGEPYRLLALPLPAAIHDENGERLPATYANYLVLNGAVLYPTYAQPENDAAAARVLRQAFPDRDIVGVDCRALIRQHGSLHCATMQYPRGVLSL